MAQTLKELMATNPAEDAILKWMPTSGDEDLSQCRSMFAHNPKLTTAAQTILEARRHAELLEPQKPHWTFAPTFLVTVVILIVAVLAWLFPREPKKDAPISQPVSSNPATSIYTPTPPTNAARSQSVLPVAVPTSPPASSVKP